MAKLSVIFPVGRITELTVPSLESILNQTFSDFLIFIVDNTKGWELRELLRPYLGKKVVYLTCKREFGAAVARNYALDYVQSEFIAIHDSDDFSLPNHFQTAVKTLSETKADVYCCGYKNRLLNGLEFNRIPAKNIDLFNLLTCNPIGHSTVLMRASIKPRYETTKRRHDLRLWLTLYAKGTKFVTNDDVMVIRNIIPGSLSEKKLRLVWDHYVINRKLMKFSVSKSIVFLSILCFRHLIMRLHFQFMKFKRFLARLRNSLP